MMRLSIVNVEKLPLGTRVLRPGLRGADIKKLQELLTQNGFYFGKIDGVYGLLTEEAVRLLQRTFKLKIDGIAGPVVNTVLKNPFRKIGRIIYTVKTGENLITISHQFTVNSNAWESLPGRGNPGKRLYPGMRLLLHEKALFVWDKTPAKTGSSSTGGSSKSKNQLLSDLKVTQIIQPGFLIEESGTLICRAGEPVTGSDAYQLIEAQPEVWNGLFSSKERRTKLSHQLHGIKSLKFGFDLRAAPLNTIFYWPKFLKSLCNHLSTNRIHFLVLPLLPKNTRRLEPHSETAAVPLYWLYLPDIAQFARLLIFEPLFNPANPSSYENSAAALPQTLVQLTNQQLNTRSLLMVTADCRDWNQDLNSSQAIPYQKAKMIQAMNPRSTQYSVTSKLTMVNYFSHRQPHCLIYRDIQGFKDLFTLVNQVNLLGLVVRHFELPGQAGVQAILDSFAVLPEVRLNSSLD